MMERWRAAEVRITKCAFYTKEAQALLEEYYDAIGVVVRDGTSEMRRLIADARSGMWMAYKGSAVAGCVVLKGGIPTVDAGECKRLYVRPDCRRSGVAEALMEALEGYAREMRFAWVYLDTNDAFRASVGLYRGRGYEPCERYNDNPQATLFFRKRLKAGMPSVDGIPG